MFVAWPRSDKHNFRELCMPIAAWWTYGIVFERYCGIDSIYGWLSDFDQLVGLRAVS